METISRKIMKIIFTDVHSEEGPVRATDIATVPQSRREERVGAMTPNPGYHTRPVASSPPEAVVTPVTAAADSSQVATTTSVTTKAPTPLLSMPLMLPVTATVTKESEAKGENGGTIKNNSCVG